MDYIETATPKYRTYIGAAAVTDRPMVPVRVTCPDDLKKTVRPNPVSRPWFPPCALRVFVYPSRFYVAERRLRSRGGQMRAHPYSTATAAAAQPVCWEDDRRAPVKRQRVAQRPSAGNRFGPIVHYRGVVNNNHNNNNTYVTILQRAYTKNWSSYTQTHTHTDA